MAEGPCMPAKKQVCNAQLFSGWQRRTKRARSSFKRRIRRFSGSVGRCRRFFFACLCRQSWERRDEFFKKTDERIPLDAVERRRKAGNFCQMLRQRGVDQRIARFRKRDQNAPLVGGIGDASDERLRAACA